MDLSHEQRLTATEAMAKSNKGRIERLEERQDNLEDLVGTVKALAVREENVESDVKEIKSDIKTIMGKSGQRWDGLVDKALWACAAGAIGYALSHIGF